MEVLNLPQSKWLSLGGSAVALTNTVTLTDSNAFVKFVRAVLSRLRFALTEAVLFDGLRGSPRSSVDITFQF